MDVHNKQTEVDGSPDDDEEDVLAPSASLKPNDHNLYRGTYLGT